MNERRLCVLCEIHHNGKGEYIERVEQKGNTGSTNGKRLETVIREFECLDCGSHFSFIPIGEGSTLPCAYPIFIFNFSPIIALTFHNLTIFLPLRSENILCSSK